jgi:hypothetical protein
MQEFNGTCPAWFTGMRFDNLDDENFYLQNFVNIAAKARDPELESHRYSIRGVYGTWASFEDEEFQVDRNLSSTLRAVVSNPQFCYFEIIYDRV